MDVDTSSYKNDPQPSLLDTAGKFGALQAQQQGIQRQGIGIEADKLKLAGERLGMLSKEYTTLLADNDVMTGAPAATAKVQAMGQRMVNLGVIPANMFGEFVKSVPTDPKQIPQFIQQQMARVQTIDEAVRYHQGQLGPQIANGQTIQNTRWSPKTGLIAEGQPIQQQIPVTQPVINKEGREVTQGPTESVAAPGAVVGPPNRLPVAPNVNMGPPLVSNKNQAQVTPGNPRSPVTVPEPTGPAVGQPVSFETNRLSHVKDYEEAASTLQATRPLIKAYKLIDEFNPRSGPGTETWNKWVAAAKTWGIVDTQNVNDPTAVYQQINKYLAQNIAQQGAPSDKQQAQQALGSADIGKQILPALKKLTYDTIALQRGRAILPYMYNSADYGSKNYQEEKGKNIHQLSQKALMLDHVKDDKEYNAILEDMKKKRNTPEGRKFERTLEAMKRGGWDTEFTSGQ